MRAHNRKDLKDKKFGKWTVINDDLPLRVSPGGSKARVVWCKCECGVEKEVLASHLQSRKSNGCSNCSIIRGKDRSDWTGCGEITGHIWDGITRRANGRKRKDGGGRIVPFDITIEYAWDLFLKQERKCAITGIDIFFPKNYLAQRQREWTASLDKIDNFKGYVKDNVQWVHKDINMLKNIFSQERFIGLCHLVAKNNPDPKIDMTTGYYNSTKFHRNETKNMHLV